ncbi:hypothetical protein AWB80_07561 [Caballeronia pedi]|uniref:Uncharacterized protein n=1 Tax=Caballeronia pedi TaxID=1777141 RepID=A0A158DWP7_9BURK|nr:hypothetical protein [Caballeronia pedi]SAK98626.1 hypothetical protein AWB80_07561 [Caballeronia pedi]
MALFDATPSSQKPDACPISFALFDFNASSKPKVITLWVRPEDLTRTDPSRVTVQQTFGGAFADNFGKGVAKINISGNTGWAADTTGADGVQRFIDLKTLIFDGWHQAKANAYKSGKDPSKVQLAFVDTLNQFTSSVIPGEVTLRRSRSRPLLLQYQIPMTVTSDLLGAYVTPSSSSGASSTAAGLSSILQSIADIGSFANGISSWINSTILAPIKGFLKTTQAIFSTVTTAIKSVTGIATSLMNVAKTVAQAGANLVRTAIAIISMPATIKAMFMGIASAFTNIFCVLKNAVNTTPMYQDYSAIYGSSNCSSTSGGRPLSAYASTNTFAAVAPLPVSTGVNVNASAQTSLNALAKTDPVLSPMSSSTLASHLNTINSGLTVSA